MDVQRITDKVQTDVARVTGQVQKVAATTRTQISNYSGPSLVAVGLVQVVAAFNPTTTIGRIAQGVAFTVLGVLVWEFTSKNKNGNGT